MDDAEYLITELEVLTEKIPYLWERFFQDLEGEDQLSIYVAQAIENELQTSKTYLRKLLNTLNGYLEREELGEYDKYCFELVVNGNLNLTPR